MIQYIKLALAVLDSKNRNRKVFCRGLLRHKVFLLPQTPVYNEL